MSYKSSSTVDCNLTPAEKAKRCREKVKVLELERKNNLSRLYKSRQHYTKKLNELEYNNNILINQLSLINNLYENQANVLNFINCNEVKLPIEIKLSEISFHHCQNNYPLFKPQVEIPFQQPATPSSLDNLLDDCLNFSINNNANIVETEFVRDSFERVCQTLDEICE